MEKRIKISGYIALPDGADLRAGRGVTAAQSVGRSRGKGARRSRSIADSLPQPRAVRREALELMARAQVFSALYGIEHDALAAIGSSDVKVQSSPELTTVEAAVDDANQLAARDRCRSAVKLLREAANKVEEALRAFGPLAEQPSEPSRYAVIDRATFDRALHRKREEELRRG